MNNPPVPKYKYKYTLEVEGNSHAEIVSELLAQVNGGYMLDSQYEERDEFEVIGGQSCRTLEHINPEMTPERYARELGEWYRKRKRGAK